MLHDRWNHKGKGYFNQASFRTRRTRITFARRACRRRAAAPAGQRTATKARKQSPCAICHFCQVTPPGVFRLASRRHWAAIARPQDSPTCECPSSVRHTWQSNPRRLSIRREGKKRSTPLACLFRLSSRIQTPPMRRNQRRDGP